MNEVTVLKPVAISAPSCVPGEVLVITGTIRHHVRLTVDDSGGLHFQDHRTAHGSGSGFDPVDVLFSTPLASYSFSEEEFQQFNFPNPTFETTMVFYTKVIRRGESAPVKDDLFLREHVKFTRNANGVVTAEFVRGPEMECR